ncbi:EAL domain-containing protein [Marinomonas rhizomae]|uniref:PAS domain S-box-containing protein/diguanylate cyclase (GGDEF)-like protein n=1 Tax=Marinomonas rhizomae TaxID=491948 RepID=A0A366IVV4_9GAMM|nr:EAL domain-containing protein [Marinomonas rhizomae]RBP78300.1 PAS domain S-box-containing protein/diguanylate cyclase (GGDEF)-like protein [Marinomonas rhizomae]RNF69942.1 EAL domain-containing protein [Marinomonas rhizomae]
MFKQIQQMLGIYIRRQPVLIPAAVVLVIFMLVLLQQLLQRGYERALKEQLITNTALIYAIEDSVTRSIQAVNGSLTSLATQIPELSEESRQSVEQQMLRSLPQLRSIDVIPLAKATLCQPLVTSLKRSETRMLAPQNGRQWGVSPNLKGLQYWPVCSPFYVDDQLKGFIVGSINPHYYSNLISATEYGGREIEIFHSSGENMLGGASSMPLWIQMALQDKAWGKIRVQDDSSSGYLENFRATSLIPLVVTLRSYDRIDLSSWFSDVLILKWSFGLLVLAVLLVSTTFMILKNRQEYERGSNLLLSEAMRNTANAIFITDSKGKIHWINQAFTYLTGYSLKEVRGKTPNILNSGYQDKRYFNALWRTVKSGQSWRGELINRDKHGRLISVNQIITPIKSAAGEIEHFIAVHEDISARKEAEEKASFLAKHDGLTGLANRHHFEEHLGELFHSCVQGNIGLIFIDLDRFKEINDTLGHEAGDVLLKRTANKLKQVLPDETILARLGGDEFALLVYPLVDVSDMSQLAKNIVATLATPFDYCGSKFAVTCSVGVAVSDIGKTDASTLLRQADMAMYRAKQEGRNTYQLFDQSMAEVMKHRVYLQQELDASMCTGEGFSLHFQPQVDAQTYEVVGAEVLFRWQRKSGENISPGELIPILEESGQIVALGKWIIEASCKQLCEWRELGLDLGKVAINISPVQLSSSNVADDLLAVMNKYNIPSSAMSVEFTETALLVSSPILTYNLTRFGEEGITIAIDDFGTGYCSLAYLKRLDAHYLKIDQSFIAGIGHNEADESIVLATIAMAKGLKMYVIAEGVETQTQINFLIKHQCDILQGYFFGKPMPAPDYQSYLNLAKESYQAVSVEL